MIRLFFILCLALSGTVTPASANNIAAVVNEDIITSFAVDNRLKLALLSSRIPNNAKTRNKLRTQILQSLVDEAIQRQEADRLKVSITDEDYVRALRDIEKRNKLPAGGMEKMLKQANIPMQTMQDQLKTSILWADVVKQSFRRNVTVSNSEIDTALEKLSLNQGKPQYLISEIFISNRDESSKAQATASDILSTLKKGANFSTVAREFSDSATAALGGDMGWVMASDLDRRLADALAKLKPGQVSFPIRMPDGLTILLLKKKRLIGAKTSNSGNISLYQLSMTGGSNTGKKLMKTISSVKSCADARNLASRTNGLSATNLGTFKYTDLAKPLQHALSNKKTGDKTTALSQGNNWSSFVVCRRDVSYDDLPSRDEIGNRLKMEKINRFAKQYMQKLRRKAYIDIR